MCGDVGALCAGDVLLHCVVDAILGALGLPDIGQIFPDSDPKWKGAASSVFIKEAVSFCTFPFDVHFCMQRLPLCLPVTVFKLMVLYSGSDFHIKLYV